MSSIYKVVLHPLSRQITLALRQIEKDRFNRGTFKRDQYVMLSLYRDDINNPTEPPLIKLKRIMGCLRRGDLHSAAVMRYTEETADRLCRLVDLSDLKSPEDHFELWKGQMVNLADSLDRVGY